MIHAIDTGFLVAAEVEEHLDHADARETLTRLVERGDQLAIVPQVIAEFLHVVTDSRRFLRPLQMDTALHLAERWWTAREVVLLLPGDASVRDFLTLVRQFRLGRKRLLDTLFAATLRREGIVSILTTNVRDFEVFGCFTLVPPRSVSKQ